MSQPTIKIKHIKATDDYIAAEETQKQNWQYFIEHITEIYKSKEIGSTIKKSEDIITTVEYVTMAKKSNEFFYKVIERNFYSTMNKLSLNKPNQIKDNFLREKVWCEGVIPELDSWIAFYFKQRRFPG